MLVLHNESKRSEFIEHGKEFFYNDKNLEKVKQVLDSKAPCYDKNGLEFETDFKPV